MRNFIIAGIFLIAFGCSNQAPKDYTTVKVVEVQQVGSYTYLLVKEKGPEYWIAVSSIAANPGETYYYKGGLVMEDFYSQELDRTFDKVLFLDEVISADSYSKDDFKEVTPGSKVEETKSNVTVKPGEGTTTVAELFANPESYENKKVRVTGKVTKFNAAIMDRNWVHIQDGTEHEGKFDLTATSAESFEVGSEITVEGIIKLNLDFGYGYSYELLLEEATMVVVN